MGGPDEMGAVNLPLNSESGGRSIAKIYLKIGSFFMLRWMTIDPHLYRKEGDECVC